MSTRHVACVMASLALAACHSAPDVSAIAQRHLEAVGGADAFRSLQSWRVAGVHHTADNRSFPFLAERKRPNLCRSQTGDPTDRRVRGYNGTVAWLSEPGQPVRLLSGPELEERVATCDFDDDPLLDSERRGIAVRLAGQPSLDGRPTYKLFTKTPWGLTRYVYVDAATWLDVRIDHVDPDGTVTVQRLFDRRLVGGISTPTTWVTTVPDGRTLLTTHADSVELNVPFADGYFDPPGAE